MHLKDKDLILITGGEISSQLLNAFVRVITSVVEVGRMIGSSIRRLINKNYC